MSNGSRPGQDGDAAMFRQALEEHGHAFQYATIAAIERAGAGRARSWQFLAAEAPIVLHGEDVHADLIFRAGSLYLVGECKRVNPAYSEWLFGRSRYTTSGPAPVLMEELFIEHASSYQPHVRPRLLASAADSYQVAITVKTRNKGQGCVSDKNAIDEAVKQVCRAASGLTQLCAENAALAGLGVGSASTIVPAIFTTAGLHTCDVKLEASNLASGDLPEDAGFTPRSWLWFQRGLSASMQAPLPGRFVAEQAPTWSQFFTRSAVRSVAIVNVEGIAAFLDYLDDF